MPRKTASIGSLRANDWPDPEEIKHYFLEFEQTKWSPTGDPEAGFAIHGVDGTEELKLGEGRIDLHLSIYYHAGLGLQLIHARSGDVAPPPYFYSVVDKSKILETVADHLYYPRSLGLFIPPDQAWLAVEDFLNSDGGLSPRIRWIEEGELPDEIFPDE